MTTMSMYMEHTVSYGVTTDALGTDGGVVQLFITNFRQVADCAGMFRSFKVLAFGLDFGACTLNSTAVTYRTINLAMRANQIP